MHPHEQTPLSRLKAPAVVGHLNPAQLRVHDGNDAGEGVDGRRQGLHRLVLDAVRVELQPQKAHQT